MQDICRKMHVLTSAHCFLSSFVGVVLVSLSDSSQPQPSEPSTGMSHLPSMPIVGDALALLSALGYALYVTLLKVRIRSESRVDMQLFFGFVGLFNILGCWPIGVVLHLTGVERFELPHTSKAVMALLINVRTSSPTPPPTLGALCPPLPLADVPVLGPGSQMAITLSSDYIYVIAMLKTTPLVVTVGLSLTMPLAVLGDFFLGRPARAQVVFGALIVVSSFLALGLEEERKTEESALLPGDRIDQEAGRVHLEEEVLLSD